MKPLLLLLHFLILTGSGISLYDLWADLTRVSTEKVVATIPDIPQISKGESLSPVTARQLFDTLPTAAAASGTAGSDKDTHSAQMDQKKKQYQIRGIFTSDTDRFALLEPDSQKGAPAELQKVTEGAGLEDYTVSAISPRMVRLTDTISGETIRLKAFSRIDAASDSSGKESDTAPKSANKPKKNQQ